MNKFIETVWPQGDIAKVIAILLLCGTVNYAIANFRIVLTPQPRKPEVVQVDASKQPKQIPLCDMEPPAEVAHP